MINLLIYIVSTVLTYVLGLVAKKFKWNETLPIPIQNIIVGVTVFVIASILSSPCDSEQLLNQIIVALGGAGTATLGYDTNQIKEGE